MTCSKRGRCCVDSGWCLKRTMPKHVMAHFCCACHFGRPEGESDLLPVVTQEEAVPQRQSLLGHQVLQRSMLPTSGELMPHVGAEQGSVSSQALLCGALDQSSQQRQVHAAVDPFLGELDAMGRHISQAERGLLRCIIKLLVFRPMAKVSGKCVLQLFPDSVEVLLEVWHQLLPECLAVTTDVGGPVSSGFFSWIVLLYFLKLGASRLPGFFWIRSFTPGLRGTPRISP